MIKRLLIFNKLVLDKTEAEISTPFEAPKVPTQVPYM